MLDRIFMQIVKMGFMASIVIAVVLFARLILKKSPKIFSYALWSVVLIRLIYPFSIKSVLSVIPKKADNFSQQIVASNTPYKVVSAPSIINTPQMNVDPPAQIIVTKSINWIFFIEFLWIIGILAMLLYSVISFIKLKKSLKYSLNYRDNIYLCENLKSPFVMGIFSSKIYLPSNLTEDEREYIILHEKMHIKRFDHIIKIISFLVLCVHWFNPFVWIAFFISGRDMEMSCDESVIRKLGNDVKKDYSTSLLSLATGKRIVGGMPLAFGEGNTKGRIKNILSYKKPRFWAIIVCVLAVIAVCVGLMTNPKEKKTDAENTYETLYLYRTEDLYDKENIEPIINNLEFPEKYEYIDYSIENKKNMENSIILNFETDADTFDNLTVQMSELISNNALKMLSLIKNAENIYVSVNSDSHNRSTVFMRGISGYYNDEDCWLASETKKSFVEFCKDIDRQSEEDIENDDGQIETEQTTVVQNNTENEDKEIETDNTQNLAEDTTLQTVSQISNSNYISAEKVRLITFSGTLDNSNSSQDLQTSDADIVTNFINEFNIIKPLSIEKAYNDSVWKDGLWTVYLYKDGKLTYAVHSQQDEIVFIEYINNKLYSTLLEVNDEIRKEFEKKVFNFNENWTPDVYYFSQYYDEIKDVDSYAGSRGDTIYASTTDFSEYISIEKKYCEFDKFVWRNHKYQTVEYNMSDVNKACNELFKKGKEYDIKDVTFKPETNTITVEVENATEDLINKIKSFTDIKNVEVTEKEQTNKLVSYIDIQDVIK